MSLLLYIHSINDTFVLKKNTRRKEERKREDEKEIRAEK